MASKKKIASLDSLYQKAEAAENRGDVAAAEKHYRAALAIRPNLGTWGVVSWLLLSAGEFKDALAGIKKMRTLALKNRSRSMMSLSDCLMGRIHHDAGRKVLAERYYRESLEAKPRTETNVFLGALLEELDRGSEAKRCYQKAVQIDPGNYEAHFNLGKWYTAHEDFERAVRHLRQAIEMNEYFTEAVSLLVQVLWQYGYNGFSLAKNLLEKTLVDNMTDVDNHLLLGFTYKLLGRKRDADRQFRFTADELAPSIAAAIAYAEYLSGYSRKQAEAETYFQKAVEIDPEDALPHYYYGKFLMAIGRKEDAASHLTIAAELGEERAAALLGDVAAVLEN